MYPTVKRLNKIFFLVLMLDIDFIYFSLELFLDASIAACAGPKEN